MSFDLILQAFQNGDESVGNKQNVLQFLSRFSCSSQDQFGCFNVTNDANFEISLNHSYLFDETKKFSGASFHLHDFSITELSFIYDFANAAGFVIINPQAGDNEPMMIVPKSVMPDDLPDDFQDSSASINSGIELKFLLSNDFEAWEKFRDEVVSKD